MTQPIEISLPTGSRSDSVSMRIAQIIEARRLRMHRLSTRQIGSDKYLVGRVGARGAITTSSLGVAAISLLREGRPPREVETFLGRKTNTTVEISALLSALLRAGFIRRADSLQLETRHITIWTQLSAYLRSRIRPLVRLTDFLSTSVPPSWGLRPLRAIRYRALSASVPFGAKELTRSISAGEPPIPIEMCRKHQRELADQDSLTRIIIQAEPRRLDRWVRKNVTLIGRQHLVDSISAGCGTIVVTFHYGAFPLMPVCLAANGFSISMPHFGVQFGAIPHERVFDAHVEACGWAPVVVHRTGSLATVAQLVRTLRSNGVVCISVDYCNPRVPHNSLGRDEKSNRQTQIGVVVAGRRIMVENWVGWLAATTNSAVLPSLSLRKTRSQYAIALRPALEFVNSNHLPSREYATAITRNVVAALEPDVAADPLKWAFLSTFADGRNAYP